MVLYPPEIHVFDFDDTLMWSPPWYFDAETDKDSRLINPGSSYSLKKALRFLDSMSRVASRFENMFLKAEDIHKPDLGKPNSKAFVLTTSDGQPLQNNEIKSFFSRKILSKAAIDVSGRFIEFAAVTDDPVFYQDSETLGLLGINPKIFNIYLKHNDSAAILTGRDDVPGIRERILEIMQEYGAQPPPMGLYIKPPMGTSGGDYKAKIIIELFQNGPEMICFYDDNLKYIASVEKNIQEYDSKHNKKLGDRLKVFKTDISEKPIWNSKRIQRFKSLDKYKSK